MLTVSLAMCAALTTSTPQTEMHNESYAPMRSCVVVADDELAEVRGIGYTPRKKLRELINELIRHDAYARNNIAMIEAFDWTDWIGEKLRAVQ